MEDVNIIILVMEYMKKIVKYKKFIIIIKFAKLDMSTNKIYKEDMNSNIESNKEKIDEMLNDIKVSMEQIKLHKEEKEKLKKVLSCKTCGKFSEKPKFVQTKCNHIFCSSCIKNIISTSQKQCPICKKFIEKGSLYSIKL
jgi:hypothetical protein